MTTWKGPKDSPTLLLDLDDPEVVAALTRSWGSETIVSLQVKRGGLKANVHLSARPGRGNATELILTIGRRDYDVHVKRSVHGWFKGED